MLLGTTGIPTRNKKLLIAYISGSLDLWVERLSEPHPGNRIFLTQTPALPATSSKRAAAIQPWKQSEGFIGQHCSVAIR